MQLADPVANVIQVDHGRETWATWRSGEARGAGEPRRSRPAPRYLGKCSVPEGRPGNVVNLPDLTSERDDVGSVLDDFDRGRPVQPADDSR